MLEVVTIQDGVLQLLKKAEAGFYRRAYARLNGDRVSFEREGRIYESYPPIKEDAKMLVYKPDDIGDAIYALPALKAFRKLHPRAKLYLLCQDKTRAVYERTQLFDQVVGVSVKTRWLRFQNFELEKALDQLPVEIFDLAIFLRTYPAYYRQFRQVRAHFQVLPSDPRLKTSSPFVAYTTPLSHQSNQMAEILERVSKSKLSREAFPEFHWTEADKTALAKVFGTEAPDRFWVIHPYARFETRRYPYEYWRDVLFELQKTGVSIVIVGGKEDRPLRIQGAIEVQGQLGLTETGYLISKSAGFIGNESGPAHWASVLGIPTVMIMSGHSHLSEWGPLGKNLVLRHSVPCENCYLRACPKYKVRCLTEMPSSSVAPKILEFLR